MAWQNYPQNLTRVTSYDHEYDLQSYSTQLRDDSTRLFVDPTDSINLKTIHIANKGTPNRDVMHPTHRLT